MSGPVRVLLADDRQLIRTAVRLTAELAPDVVVMDICIPGVDGIEATRGITTDPSGSSASARVLVITTFDDDDHVYGALRAGASGFLVKGMALDDIIGAVRVVAAGDALIAPGVARRRLGHFAASRPERARARRELRASRTGNTHDRVQVVILAHEAGLVSVG